MEVILGPETGKSTTPVELGMATMAIGRSKKFVCGKANAPGLLLTLDLDVSSRHAQIEWNPRCAKICIQDCKSTNGTKVNDNLLPSMEPWPLTDCDTIGAGCSLIVYRVHSKCPQCENRSIKPVSPPQTITFDEPQQNCVVCGDSLMGLGEMDRHAHVNQCLDVKKGAKKSSFEKQQIDLALAMSRSIVDEHIENNVTKGLLERQILDIDAQIEKLQKKREKLIRALQKTERQSRKLVTSQILPPQAVVEWSVEAQLARLFPESKRQTRQPKTTAKSSALWTKASTGPAADDSVYLVHCFHQYEQVPRYVSETFPEWRENLEFVSLSSRSSLEAALDRLVAAKATLDRLDPKWLAFSFFEKRMRYLLDNGA
ncbi:hypothetical protein AeMF1_015764 [Aphanomyces euteiches]|nr:hypothetical protein AeMF1_015764 [Aphanomyces euteiches]KAH9197077.1 hypothetical protein AeNC1_000932 [Aphanomyces euteiches]